MGGWITTHTIDKVRFQWPLNVDLRMLKDIVRNRNRNSIFHNVYVVDGFIGRSLGPDMITEKELDIVKRKFDEWVTLALNDVKLYQIRF
jgi:hypothetical protein